MTTVDNKKKKLCVTEKSPKFATYSERHNCMTC